MLSGPDMCSHSLSFNSVFTDATMHCDVVSLIVTTYFLSGPYTVFPTGRFSFQILVVRRERNKFSHF